MTLNIRPVKTKYEEETFILILFEEEIPEKEELRDDLIVTVQGVAPCVAELEQELTATKEHLLTTVEELETAMRNSNP